MIAFLGDSMLRNLLTLSAFLRHVVHTTPSVILLLAVYGPLTCATPHRLCQAEKNFLRYVCTAGMLYGE